MTVTTLARGRAAEEIAARVEAALAQGEAESRRLSIARIPVDITAESGIAPFVLTPFAHLRTADDGPAAALRIEVAVLRESDAVALGLDGVPDSGVLTSAGQTVVHLHRHSAIRLDRDAGLVRAMLREADGLASWQRAKPLQLPLSIFFADRGVDLLHGGLVSLNGRGLLIAGAGGAGKSTLALASVLRGLDFLGDDCVGVGRTDGAFLGFSIFGSSCLERDHLRRFSSVPSPEGGAVDEKAVLQPGRWFEGRMGAETSIRAIVLPRVTAGGSVTVAPAGGRDALLALAPGSILKRAVPAAGALARMTRLARELPAFRLEMGPVNEAGARMRALLEELGP